MMKALTLMRTSQSVQQRADEYSKSIKREIQKGILDTITAKIEALVDKEFELSNFTLGSDLNAGMMQMSREDCQRRFEELIDISYKKKLLKLELDEKQKAFDYYFGEEKPADVVTTAAADTAAE